MRSLGGGKPGIPYMSYQVLPLAGARLARGPDCGTTWVGYLAASLVNLCPRDWWERGSGYGG